MALDAALLRIAGPPTLRLYSWCPPAVSLGWFQRAEDVTEVAPELPRIRRLTGGAAIAHTDEWTFALTGTTDLLPDADLEAGYRLLHTAVRRALARCGVESVLAAPTAPAPSPRARDGALCFRHPVRHDLLAPDGRKLCGSAQRRVGGLGRLLHHGSIPRTRGPHTDPRVAVVADQREVAREELDAALRAEFASVLDLTPVDGTLTEHERRLADDLIAGAALLPPHRNRTLIP